MTIEQLEALEKAATAGPFAHDVDRRYGGADQIVELSSGRHLTIVFGTSNGNENDLPLLVEARNALPALLAVAKAAKAYHDMATSRYYSSRVAEFKRKQDELGEALSRLEAQ